MTAAVVQEKFRDLFGNPIPVQFADAITDLVLYGSLPSFRSRSGGEILRAAITHYKEIAVIGLQ